MLNYNYYMSCHMALLRGLVRGLASHWSLTLVLVLFPLVALLARGTHMFMPVFHQVDYDLDTGQTQKDGIGYIISCNHFIHHTRLPSVLTCKRLVGSNK